MPLERIAWAIVRDWALAADAVQEAFGLLAEKWNQVAEADRRGWLVRTVQFQALNLRRQHRRTQVGSDLVQQHLTQTTAQQSWGRPPWEAQEDRERLRQAVADLPEEQRQVVQKRLVEQLSFQEIANELQLPLGTTLSRMRLALKKLRAKLLDEN